MIPPLAWCMILRTSSFCRMDGVLRVIHCLYAGCEEHLDLAGTGSFYNDGETDIVVHHVLNLIYSDPSTTVLRDELITEIITHESVPSTDGLVCRYLFHERGRPFTGDTWMLPTKLDRFVPGLRLQYDHLHSSEMKDFHFGRVDW
ncbi:hypothetical protein KSP39_PZI008945 [Platanthera zijinensis]|uniref:Uncharacterized protein n=1 Tax=Platanthera zijinensis TaxID=2320716 RepID=A0AAP0BK44_9ASPA